MTVATQINFMSYSGDGIATVFPFTFPIYETSHLVVYTQDKTTLVQTLITSYTASGIGSETGGSVTLSAPLASTNKLQ